MCRVLQACDLGHRVVVRYRVGTTDAGHALLTDVLGELVGLTGATLVVRPDAGEEQVVARSSVFAAKRVPPRPPRWSEMLELERVADRAWPAPIHEQLGEWYLRAAQGWTNRANSALPLGDPGRALGEAIDACRTWYAALGLRPRITVPLPVRRDIADALTALGWYPQPRVLVQVAPLRAIIAAVPEPPSPVRVELTGTPSPQFLGRLARWKSEPPDSAHHILAGNGPVAFAEIRDEDGSVVATGRGAVVADWQHLGLVEVAPLARRRGLARAVTRALASWAVQRGARRAVLQVEHDSTAAIALYASLGFTTHHSYVTFAGPPG